MADDAVIDLASRQRARLDAEITRLRTTNAALIAMAKANLAAQAQAHSAVLSVMEAATLAALDRSLAGRTAGALGVDIVRVFVEGHALLPKGEAIRPCAPDLVGALLGGKAERLGLIDARFADALYAGQAARLRSEALVRIDLAGKAGVVCLASRDAEMFRPDQGADLLHFFARAVERQIAPWLKA